MRRVYYPGDDEEVLLSKKIWLSIAVSCFLLGGLVMAFFWWWRIRPVMILMMAVFCGFFLISLLLFLRVRNHVEWFFLSSETFKILFSFVFVLLCGGILESGGMVFIGMAGIFFALVFPRPGQVRFLLWLYLGTVLLEALLQPFLTHEPPFTPAQNLFFFVNIFFGAVLSLFIFVRIFLRERVRFRQLETEKLRALDAARSRFFTNISHEFRTPLTVIMGMAEEIREDPDQMADSGTRLIRRNGRKLLRLVDQLLDLSRLEAGALSAHYVQADVVMELRYLLESFHSLAEIKNIRLHFSSSQEMLRMDFDPEKLGHLAGNLLDNAIKYTPAGGEVRLEVEQLPSVPSPLAANRCPGPCLVFRVTDTGIGIPAQHQERIFDRFYRIGEWPTKGTGVGLAMVREYVRLFDGHVEVDSRPGAGSVFTVYLPVHNRAPQRMAPLSRQAPEGGPGQTGVPLSPKVPGKKPRLLIIEDNADVIRYLQHFLQKDYEVDIAPDGEEGIALALKRIPDIIISDIMMPKKDGLEVCHSLKSDFRTNHIPIILLTARADVTSRIAGLETGADAYLAKPFHRRELEVELRKLIGLREILKKKYSLIPATPPADGKPSGLNERFLYDVRQCLERHYHDETFGIKALCTMIGVSRTQLHRKLTALTGRPASHFIRSFRLQKARERLQNSRLTVAEVAYEVGFKDPYYFSRAFTREFGRAPSETR